MLMITFKVLSQNVKLGLSGVISNRMVST